MTQRTRRKKHKLRVNRTMGHGDTKNNRGGGSRGGRGDAGSKKHKRQLYQHEVGALRKLKPKQKQLALNLEDVSKKIARLLEQKDAEKLNGEIVFDGKKMGVGKILGVGELRHKAVFRNVSASAKAFEKIKKECGKFEQETETGAEKEFEEETKEEEEGE